MGFCFMGLKNEFETAVVNESPVFDPLKFYCSDEVPMRFISFLAFRFVVSKRIISAGLHVP